MTGNPAIDKLLLGLNGVAMLGSAALIWFSHNMINPPKIDPDQEFTNMARSSMVELKKKPVVFKEQVVNLYSRERRLRFLNVILNIQVFEDGQQTIIGNYKPFVLDTFIDITSNMKPEELNSVTGKILLESRLKSQVNTALKQDIVKEVYFSKFIVQ